jgi:hypothetical protein
LRFNKRDQSGPEELSMSSAARSAYDPARDPAKDALRYEGPNMATRNEASVSAISWAAVAAGAFVTCAMSLTLMTLGAGIGLSSLSFWPGGGSNTTRLAPIAIGWIILAQVIASAIGGYLAGRLRTKWVAVHSQEVYFRDTAHGFLSWAVGLLLGVLFLSSSAMAVAGSDANTTVNGASSSDYFVDSLFRTAHPEAVRNDAVIRAEASLIFANAARNRGLAAQDRTYLAELVSARTGLNKVEADRRVDDTLAQEMYAANQARKALAHSFYWLFVALLFGAFCSSFAATIGGRERDHIPASS